MTASVLETVKRRKLAWLRRVTRHDSFCKTILQGTLGTDGAAVGRGNAWWTTSKSEHPLCLHQNRWQLGPPAEKTGRGFLLNRPLCPTDDRIGQGTKLNWTEQWLLKCQNESPGWRYHDSTLQDYVKHRLGELNERGMIHTLTGITVSAYMALLTVFHFINSPDNFPRSHSVLPVLFLPYLSFQLYVSLWKSPSALV